MRPQVLLPVLLVLHIVQVAQLQDVPLAKVDILFQVAAALLQQHVHQAKYYWELIVSIATNYMVHVRLVMKQNA